MAPKGLQLDVVGDMDEAVGQAVYEAAICGDAVAVAQALGVPPPPADEEAEASTEEPPITQNTPRDAEKPLPTSDTTEPDTTAVCDTDDTFIAVTSSTTTPLAMLKSCPFVLTSSGT